MTDIVVIIVVLGIGAFFFWRMIQGTILSKALGELFKLIFPPLFRLIFRREKKAKRTESLGSVPHVDALDGYQALARETAVYPGLNTTMGILYAAVEMAGESGELLDKIKKLWRGGMLEKPLTVQRKEEIAFELGDIMWGLSNAASELGYRLSEIADMNIQKLTDRKQRDVIKGFGDNR
ncbi:hypothetical protein LCGC14_0781880 [marine sediment metagenome]|uniref:NTP pyrophosphohydrolase MazG-like domain-containing protein n=1 Tax=marine sediment metagenome TaxID=412755 RepID=A0A0F9SF65_9ZZZZ